MSRFSLLCAVIPLLLLSPTGACALTGAQVRQICSAFQGDCADHPVLQAYVGGALDLVAVLQEEGKLADVLYCREARELFDVAAIIRFMRDHADAAGERNAMHLLLRYLDERGDCP